jgi:hypothetical protein
MIDIVYFLTQQTFYEHRELRYSLRSLEKHVADVGQVFVVGAAPVWPISGVIHIPECDPYEVNRDANIIHKMRIACRNQEISRPFLFVNDDHYFSRDCRAGEFPYYHKGEIRAAASSNREYNRRLGNTRRLLEEKGLGTLNFDVHTPILIDPARFLAAFEGWDWADEEGPGVVMKSVYGNSCLVAQASPPADIVYLPDCKLTVRTGGQVNFWVAQLQERPCWSSGNYIPRLVGEILEKMYPEPSKFER